MRKVYFLILMMALSSQAFAQDSLNVMMLGLCDTPGFANDVAVWGNYAYIADDTEGLRVMDISDPTHPLESGFFDTPDCAGGVAVNGNYAYVADWSSGLRVFGCQ